MGSNDRIDFEVEEQNRLLQYLVDNGTLENAAEIGIAKQIMDKGVDSLDGKQVKVYEDYIKPHMQKECQTCSEEFTVDELMNNCKFCDRCENLLDKE